MSLENEDNVNLSTCKYTDKDVEYMKKQLNEIVESGVFISIEDYLIEMEKVLQKYSLNQKKDQNEVEIRTIQNLINKYKGGLK